MRQLHRGDAIVILEEVGFSIPYLRTCAPDMLNEMPIIDML